jgi:RNA polymerase sigma-70 factor (ECF subfamily)
MVTARPQNSGNEPNATVEQELARIARENSALVSLVLEEPRRGLAALHDRFARDVNRLVWRLLGADADHDDIVQQVFLRMLQSIGKLRSPDRLSFWVRSITVNTVRSELRKRKVRRIFLRSSPPTEENGDFTTDVESREFAALSTATLKKLPERERVVFLLYYVEALPLPEIAEICGYSTMTAKRRLADARDRFQKLITQEPGLNDLHRLWRDTQ